MSATSTSTKDPTQLILERCEQILRRTPKTKRSNIIKGINKRIASITDESRKSKFTELVKKAPYFPEPSAEVLAKMKTVTGNQKKNFLEHDSNLSKGVSSLTELKKFNIEMSRASGSNAGRIKPSKRS